MRIVQRIPCQVFYSNSAENVPVNYRLQSFVMACNFKLRLPELFVM